MFDYRATIDRALNDFFADLPAKLGMDLSEYGDTALELLAQYSLRPGKRFRGSLAAYAYDYAKKTQKAPSAIQLAVALELIQSYLLIIDDVMDKSKTRRGEPTIHKLYGASSNQWSKDEHVTNMLAISVGLLAQHLASIIIADLTDNPNYIKQALKILHTNITGTVFGQIDDLAQQVGIEITEADVERKHLLKSSYYTFVNPLQLGFILAGKADTKTMGEFYKFGSAAGIAFQLHDDMLGVFGDEQKTGKSNLDDIREGKNTSMVHFALEKSNPKDKQRLMQLLGKIDITQIEGDEARAILEKTGARKYAQTQAERFAHTAKEVIVKSELWDDQAKKNIQNLVDFTVSREK